MIRELHAALGLKYRFDRARWWVRRFGFRRAIAERRRMSLSADTPIEVQVPGLAHPVAIRAGTADVSTFEHIFVWNDYDLAFPAVVRTIIDAGANTGLAAVFFANRFPEAKIISIEPEAENFEILRRNTAPYPNIVALHAALWGEDTFLGIANPDARVDSYRFEVGAGQQRVEAFSVQSILQRYGLHRIDILKIDIEGGETAVFESKPPWIRQVGMFVIELHNTDAEIAFSDATASLRARRWRHGENTIVVVDES